MLPKIPPSSVTIETYLDKDSLISKEKLSLWQQRLDVALEYGLKRFIGKELDYHRQVEHKKADLIKNSKIDFTDIFVDLIKIKYLSEYKDGVQKTHKDFDNQSITAKTIKEFLKKARKTETASDIYLINSIVRRLDRDLDGQISLDDFIKALTPLHSDYKYNIEVTKAKLEELELDDHIAINDSVQKLFFEADEHKFRRSEIEKDDNPFKRPSSVSINKNGSPQKINSAKLIGSPFDVWSSPDNMKEITSLSISNAMTWSQFLKSGNKMAVVYIDDESPSKTKLQHMPRSAKKRRSSIKPSSTKRKVR